MTVYLDILTIVSVGLMTGTEFAVSAFVNPLLRKLDDRSQAIAIRLFSKRLGTIMPFWYGGNLVLLVGEMLLRRNEPNIQLLIAACAVWACSIVLTLIFLVPINNRLATLPEEGLTAELKREHRIWDTRHRLRIAALTVAMVLLLEALLHR